MPLPGAKLIPRGKIPRSMRKRESFIPVHPSRKVRQLLARKVRGSRRIDPLRHGVRRSVRQWATAPGRPCGSRPSHRSEVQCPVLSILSRFRAYPRTLLRRQGTRRCRQPTGGTPILRLQKLLCRLPKAKKEPFSTLRQNCLRQSRRNLLHQPLRNPGGLPCRLPCDPCRSPLRASGPQSIRRWNAASVPSHRRKRLLRFRRAGAAMGSTLRFLQRPRCLGVPHRSRPMRPLFRMGRMARRKLRRALRARFPQLGILPDERSCSRFRKHSSAPIPALPLLQSQRIPPLWRRRLRTFHLRCHRCGRIPDRWLTNRVQFPPSHPHLQAFDRWRRRRRFR
jgi:hypothetical protein